MADEAEKKLADAAPAAPEIATVESPPLAPELKSAKDAEAEPVAPEAPAAETPSAPRLVMPKIAIPSIAMPSLSRRHKRRAALAASFIFAAALGGAAVAVALNSLAPEAPAVDVAAIEKREEATQKTIARLTKELALLKSNVEATHRNATTQLAKISDRIERVAAPETTGSVTPSATTPAPVPVPQARPAVEPPKVVEAKPAEPAPPKIVRDWVVRDARYGTVLVEGPDGLYEVIPGAPLPGLGKVETIKRQDGRWVVTTPKGIIVSMRPQRGPYDRF